MSDKSTRAIVREWVRVELDGQESVQIPDLADKAMAHFLGDDTFLARFFQENARQMVYNIAQGVVANSRGGLVQLGEEIVLRSSVKERASRKSVFANWLEHAGDRHINLLDMTREDLLTAADERDARAATEHEYARLWRAMAVKLESGQSVREVFQPEDIERLRKTIKASMRTAA